jgi:hypothetical protein
MSVGAFVRSIAWVVIFSMGVGAAAQAAIPRFEVHKIAEVGHEMGQTSLVDIDKDGDLDWVVGERTRTWWFEYAGPDRWIQHDLGQGAKTDVGGTAFDIDRDGWIDQFCGDSWYRNPGKPRTEAFERFAVRTIPCHDDVAADINGDGRTDVVAISDQQSHRVTVWYEIPANPREKWTEHPIGGGIHGGVGPKGVADLDGDGDNDVVRGDVWFENVDGKGLQWKEHVLLEGNECHEAKAADVDGDGDIDIVTKPWSDGNLHIYFQNMLVENRK